VAAPDDIWLYNSAALGWLYSAHDPAEALPWIDEALAIVNRTGDPEGLIDQLQRLHTEAVQATPTRGFGDQVVPFGDG
jgi:hypothetical protein